MKRVGSELGGLDARRMGGRTTGTCDRYGVWSVTRPKMNGRNKSQLENETNPRASFLASRLLPHNKCKRVRDLTPHLAFEVAHIENVYRSGPGCTFRSVTF